MAFSPSKESVDSSLMYTHIMYINVYNIISPVQDI